MLPLVAEIVDVPVPTLVARPVLLIVATPRVAEAHAALPSTCVELSLNVPVAVNCCVAPLVIEGFAGVTAMEVSVAGVTVSSVEPVMLPLVAEIVEVPVPTAVPSPVLLIVATVAVAEAHAALPSTCVELSLNVPVAVNCCVAPLGIDGFAGVTAMEVSVAAVTVSTAVFEVTPLCVAVMLVEPVPTLVARPVLVPMVATVVVPEAHVAVVVMSSVLASENVPTALNCCVAPLVIDGFAGVTASDTSVAGVTVSSVEPVMLPLVAEIVEVPTPAAVASPVLLIVATVPVASVEPVMLPLVAEIVEVPTPAAVPNPVLLIVATVAVAEAHTALPSTCVELSLKVPVAVNCCVAPLGIDGSGVTAMEVSVGGVTVS